MHKNSIIEDQLSQKSTRIISDEVIDSHGLSQKEYQEILDLLGRNPSFTELGIFSAMWNEHCSYKSSKKWLKKLPSSGPQVICGPGENAGIVDIGDNQAIVFKMESHNHPSFIEPFQGAATGIGGILRDIFTMGARPIATMNCLSFGSTMNSRTKTLLNGVVEGIGSYGNSFGVPNVGGELRFNNSYNDNCLVNAFAAGLVDKNKIFYSAASGVGMSVVYIGAKTGKDGVGGATMASAEFDEEIENKRPAVQVGDPFKEKCLMEACFELMNTGAVNAIQDMGAAGLTCSAVEMADKGNLGIVLNLDNVPVRDSSINAYEMMLSESQERMLVVLNPKRETEAREIFSKWDLDFSIIGQTIKEDRLKVFHKGNLEADLPLKALSGSAPEYDRPWIYEKKTTKTTPIPNLSKISCLRKLISSPNYCSRRQVWEQYDHTIMSNTVVSSGADSALIKIGESNKAIALTCDVTPRYCFSDPFEGGKQAVAEAFRNIISSGATPLAITDNLNFGNPEKPEVMGQLVMCIKGITKASKKLNMPVVSGNVSLYNETNSEAIHPTPTIGAIGILKDLNKRIPMEPKNGQNLLLLGENNSHMGRTAFREEILQEQAGDPPLVDLELELKTGLFLLSLNKDKLIESAHDISDGGIAIAAAEMALKGNVGISLDNQTIEYLYGEDQARYLISCEQKNQPKIFQKAKKEGVTIKRIGTVSGHFFSIGKEKLKLKDLSVLYQSGLKELFN